MDMEWEIGSKYPELGVMTMFCPEEVLPTAMSMPKMRQYARYVEADQYFNASEIWGLDRIDQRDLPLNNNYNPVQTGSGVTVYVIDTGIRPSHNEFGGRASVGYDAFGGSGIDDNGT